MISTVRVRGERLKVPSGWSRFVYEGDVYEAIRILDDGTMLVRRV